MKRACEPKNVKFHSPEFRKVNNATANSDPCKENLTIKQHELRAEKKEIKCALTGRNPA